GGILGEDEDYRTSVITEIGRTARPRVRADVAVKQILQVDDHCVGRVAGMIDGFVVLHRDLEVVLRRRLLQQRVTLVLELPARAIRVSPSSADVQLLSASDLLEQDRRIMA